MFDVGFKVGDRVILVEKGSDYGKMCTVIESSETNAYLPVRVQLINYRDYFDSRKYGPGVTERWIPIDDLRLAKER